MSEQQATNWPGLPGRIVLWPRPDGQCAVGVFGADLPDPDAVLILELVRARPRPLDVLAGRRQGYALIRILEASAAELVTVFGDGENPDD